MIHHTRSKIKVKWKKNIDRYILLMKNTSENLKNVMFYDLKRRKKWAFLCNPQAVALLAEIDEKWQERREVTF